MRRTACSIIKISGSRDCRINTTPRRRVQAGDGLHASLAADTAAHWPRSIWDPSRIAGTQRLPRLVGKGRPGAPHRRDDWRRDAERIRLINAVPAARLMASPARAHGPQAYIAMRYHQRDQRPRDALPRRVYERHCLVAAATDDSGKGRAPSSARPYSRAIDGGGPAGNDAHDRGTPSANGHRFAIVVSKCTTS